MPRAKDAKVWNEDLVTALRSREEQCRQRFSQRQYLWRDGAAAIASIRKDIYQYKTGKIVGLPRTLTRCVEEECRAIIEGNRPLLPEGYIPTTLEEQKMTRASCSMQRPNPYHDDPYLRRIKMRGGAYAILMAFRGSETKTMTQKQICKAAQTHCDEEMEPNFYSGRSYGAWSSKKTLVKHGLIKESRTTQMGRHGQICNGVFEYTLTENGELFLEALLKKFPSSRNERDSPCMQNENVKLASSGIKSEYTKTKKKAVTKPLAVKSDNAYDIKKAFLDHNRKISKIESSKKKSIKEFLLISDSEDDSDSCFKSYDKLIDCKKGEKQEHTKVSSSTTNVIDLVESSDEESSISEDNLSVRSTKIKTTDKVPPPIDIVPQENYCSTAIKKSTIPISKLVVLIDNRERDHNATPRHMRIELSRHLSEKSGSLRQVWPSYLPIGEVEEEQLNYGDFAFVSRQDQLCGSQRLPLTIERKRISDLVQRSSRAHHWQQLHRMRDCCEHAILLIEGNTKKTSNFISCDDLEIAESWNPDHHVIDDERAFHRFLGRLILSSPTFKVIQAKDEQASYRSIGATGLVASLIPWEKNAPKSVPATKANLNTLYNKLKSRGIPWQIARRISEELGSIQQLDRIYKHCETSARPSILVPTIREACSSMIETENSRSLLEYGTVEAWSSAIHSAWYSRMNDPAEAVILYEENKYFANDRAQLLTALHHGRTVECAVQESNIADEVNLRDTQKPIRRVRIESSSKFSTIFPSDADTETFYETVSVEENPLGLILPSVVMQTNSGKFESNKLVVCVIEGNDIIHRIQDRTKNKSNDNFTEHSKMVAKQINSEFRSFLICPKNDRRVLIIRGIGSAATEAAKQMNYCAESRVLVDITIAELMIRYNIVVIQAPRLVNDLEMILREFAMACFYYQLTTHKLR